MADALKDVLRILNEGVKKHGLNIDDLFNYAATHKVPGFERISLMHGDLGIGELNEQDTAKKYMIGGFPELTGLIDTVTGQDVADLKRLANSRSTLKGTDLRARLEDLTPLEKKTFGYSFEVIEYYGFSRKIFDEIVLGRGALLESFGDYNILFHIDPRSDFEVPQLLDGLEKILTKRDEEIDKIRKHSKKINSAMALLKRFENFSKSHLAEEVAKKYAIDPKEPLPGLKALLGYLDISPEYKLQKFLQTKKARIERLMPINRDFAKLYLGFIPLIHESILLNMTQDSDDAVKDNAVRNTVTYSCLEEYIRQDNKLYDLLVQNIEQMVSSLKEKKSAHIQTDIKKQRYDQLVQALTANSTGKLADGPIMYRDTIFGTIQETAARLSEKEYPAEYFERMTREIRNANLPKLLTHSQGTLADITIKERAEDFLSGIERHVAAGKKPDKQQYRIFYETGKSGSK